MKHTYALVCAALALCAIQQLSAQSATDNSTRATSKNGMLSGIITDRDNRTLSGVIVKVLGTVRGAYSKANGKYTVTNIPAGTYSVRYSSIGKKTVVIKNVLIKPDKTTEGTHVMLEDSISRDSVAVVIASNRFGESALKIETTRTCCGGCCYISTPEESNLTDDKKPDSSDVPLQRDLDVYPNPVHDMMTVNFRLDSNARVTFRLLSVATGEQCYFDDAGYRERGIVTHILNMTRLLHGSYLLLMQSDAGEYGYTTVMKH